MENQQAKPGVLSGIIQATNPAFVVLSVSVPVGALIYAMNSESFTPLKPELQVLLKPIQGQIDGSLAMVRDGQAMIPSLNDVDLLG